MIKMQPLKDASIRVQNYNYFRGCDVTTDPAEIDPTRSPDSLNMLADDAGFPEKRVGWRTLVDWGSNRPINGLFLAHLKGMAAPCFVVHDDDGLEVAKDFGDGDYFSKHDIVDGTKIQDWHSIQGGLKNAKSSAFSHDGKLYVFDGEKITVVFYAENASTYWFQKIHGETLTETPSEPNTVAIPKIPTTARGGHYEAEEVDDGQGGTTTEYHWVPCTAHEEPNLLSSKQINELAGDGVNTVFWLSEINTTINKVEIYGGSPASWTATTAYTKTEDTTAGKTKITFTSAPAAHPNGAGIDNIRVTFTSTEHPADPNQIAKCTICTQFGYFNNNRFFVSGNPDYPNRDWSSAVDDPTYWPINGWTDVGSDQTAIMGYLHYGDVLAIIKQDDNQDAEIYIRTAVLQDDNTVIFPCQQGVKGVGAISRGGFASLRDDALFYAREGVFAVSGTDASQQRTIQNRSYFMDNWLKNEPEKENAVAVVWNNLYMLSFPNNGHCYVADARMQTARNESFVYEWFYWTNIHANVFLEFDGKLLFGTLDGKICQMNSDFSCMIRYMDNLQRVPDPADPTLERVAWTGGQAIKAHWTTAADALGTLAHLKTLTKRGNTVLSKPYSKSKVVLEVITNAIGPDVITEAYMNVWDFSELDFRDVDFNALTTPRVVPFNSKVKKFQVIQIRLKNDEKEQCFGLFAVQLQYIVNNYIK